MHELSIASALFDIVSEKAKRFPGERVIGVTMSIGGVQALEPDAVSTCFTLLSEGSAIAGAELTIKRRPIVVFCRYCEAEREADAHFACVTCGNYGVRLVGSQAMSVEKMTLRSRENTMDESHGR